MATYPRGGYRGIQNRQDVRARDRSPESGGRPADNTRARSSNNGPHTSILRRSDRQVEQRNRRLETHRPSAEVPVETVDLTWDEPSASAAATASSQQLPNAINAPEQLLFGQLIDEDVQLQVAIQASLGDDTGVREEKLSTAGEYMKVMNQEDSKQRFEREYVCFKRCGVSITEIRVGRSRRTTVVWPDCVRHFVCNICDQLPFEPQNCKACNFTYCPRCVDIEGAYGTSCVVNRDLHPSAVEYNKHNFCGCSMIARDTINSQLMVACPFGCKNPKNDNEGLLLEWTAAVKHLRGGQDGCPYSKCNECGLLYPDGESVHKSTADCLASHKDFNAYLYGKATHLAKRSYEYINKSNQCNKRLAADFRKTTSKLYEAREDLRVARLRYEEATRARAQDSEATRRYIENMVRSSRPSEPQSERSVRPKVRPYEQSSSQSSSVQLDTNDESTGNHDLMSPYNDFWANTTNIQPTVKELLTFVAHGDFGRRQVKTSPDMTWKQLFEASCDKWKIPQAQRSDYTLLDLRMSLKDPSDEKVSSILRNVHTFSLVSKDIFEPEMTYRFKVQSAIPFYNPVKEAIARGVFDKAAFTRKNPDAADRYGVLDRDVVPDQPSTRGSGAPVGARRRAAQGGGRHRGSSRSRRDMEPTVGPWTQDNIRSEWPRYLGPVDPWGASQHSADSFNRRGSSDN